MNKELVKIQEASEKIMKAYPDKRSSFAADVQKAKSDLQKAKDRLEAAEDINEYDNAAAEVHRAELAVKFSNSALEKLDVAPRMEEHDYQNAIDTCKKIMDQAVQEYRKKAAALMEQLKTIRGEYLRTADDVNDTLVKLDNAANVLQSKYPYKEYKYVNAPSEFKKDPNAWREFAVRYDNGLPYHLATAADKDHPLRGIEKFSHWGPVYDQVLDNAWRAVSRAYDN